MKKSVLFCLLILAFQTNYSFAQSINSEKEDNWIIGKWYPAYFYYDDGEGNEVKKEFDLCITESYLEFYVKNKKNLFKADYAEGNQCNFEEKSMQGQFILDEINQEFTLKYEKGVKQKYPYQLIDKNVLVLFEYKDIDGDGNIDKVMNYYMKKII